MAKPKATASKQTSRIKTKHHEWSEDDMMQAVNAVRSGAMSARAAERTFSVPKSTLLSRVSGRYTAGVRAGRKPALSQEAERKLCDYAANRADMGFGFGRTQFLKYAGDLGKKQGKIFKKGVPSRKWWSSFKKRNPRISLRRPEATSAVRHRCMDPFKIAIAVMCWKSRQEKGPIPMR